MEMGSFVRIVIEVLGGITLLSSITKWPKDFAEIFYKSLYRFRLETFGGNNKDINIYFPAYRNTKSEGQKRSLLHVRRRCRRC